MVPTVDIRRAALSDLDAIAAIEQGCFGGDGDAFSRRQLRYLIGWAQSICHVATCGGRTTGYSVLLARKGARNLRIYSVAVDPTARGCGAGQALISAAIAQAQQCGLDEVTLEVRTDNTAALRLYEKNGFKPGQLLRGYYHDGADGRRMVLQLSR